MLEPAVSHLQGCGQNARSHLRLLLMALCGIIDITKVFVRHKILSGRWFRIWWVPACMRAYTARDLHPYLAQRISRDMQERKRQRKRGKRDGLFWKSKCYEAGFEGV